MKRLFLSLAVGALALMATLAATQPAGAQSRFVTVQGQDLVTPDGGKLFIVGTNLGNWLNPEGYMFGFSKTNCEWMINQMVCQLVGPDAAREFWQAFRDNYITEQDIEFIASTGANTVRLPFNYKLFTHEDFMGLNDPDEGFRQIDKVVQWCKRHGLYLILDMHDCPGGQTGDNIDNSYGYPWLFESERSQRLFCDIWQRIARHYCDEPTVLAYELMNEPIATYFDNKEELNKRLEPLYKRAVRAIREADTNHIVMLGGAQWNGNFSMFTDWTFDDKIMYTCHRYGGPSEQAGYQDLINFRDKTHLPMLMGETGHNTIEWQTQVAQMLRRNNIGYTFWPYKKVDESCFVAIARPAEWDSVIVRFAEADRSTFAAIRAARPDQATARRLLMQFATNAQLSRCTPQAAYIRSLGLQAP